jgi:hypothetical protein
MLGDAAESLHDRKEFARVKFSILYKIYVDVKEVFYVTMEAR